MRLLALVLALGLVFTPAFAELSKDNVVVGVEYTNLEKKVEDAEPLSLSIGSLELGVLGSIRDIDVSTVLANVGYEISENLIPYLLVGYLSTEYQYTLSGYIKGLGSLPITHSYEQGGIAWGFGARGKVLDLPKELVLSYDIRHIQSKSDDTTTTNVLWLGFPTDVDVDYGEWNASLILSRAFVLDEEMDEETGEMVEKDSIVDEITPYVGYRYTSVDMSISNDIKVLSFLNVGTEYDVGGNLHSLLAGVDVKINDNWSLYVNGVFLDEEGIMGGVMYSF